MPPDNDNDTTDTGSATDTDTDTTGTEGADDGAGRPEGVSEQEWEALGDPGKKAIDRMKANAQQAERKASDEAERRRAAEAELADLKQQNETDVDKRIREATEAAMAAANGRIVSAEVRAQAAGRLADPADAINFLDLSQFEVDSNGNVDNATISAAVDKLIESKPYLAAQSGERFQGSGDQGARKESQGPAQLTREDLKRMSPQQIVEARQSGQLDDLFANP